MPPIRVRDKKPGPRTWSYNRFRRTMLWIKSSLIWNLGNEVLGRRLTKEGKLLYQAVLFWECSAETGLLLGAATQGLQWMFFGSRCFLQPSFLTVLKFLLFLYSLGFYILGLGLTLLSQGSSSPFSILASIVSALCEHETETSPGEGNSRLMLRILEWKHPPLQCM